MNKFFWIILAAVSFLPGAWFFGKGLFQVWDYTRLEKSLPAEIINWRIVELSPSHYTLSADYFFYVGDQKWEGKTEFKALSLLNPFAAEQERKKATRQSWTVWYHARNPSISSLEKIFPSKSLFSALFCFMIVGYFLYRFQQHVEEGPVDP